MLRFVAGRVALNNRRAKIKDTLTTNIAWLMNHHGITYADIDRMANVHITGRYVHQIVRDGKTPRIDKMEAIAAIFGLTPWQLIRPSLPDEMASGQKITELIENYLRSTDEGKKHIEATADFAPKSAR